MSNNQSPESYQIVKATGETETFSSYKLNRSLNQAGVPKDIKDVVMAMIISQLKPLTTTDQIHDLVYQYLIKYDPVSATRYNLRLAIMQLGPTGFPFERYVATVLQHQGYTTEVDKIIRGACVNHEVDIVAHKGKTHIMIEWKFHNKRGARSDVKTALYVWARYQDILEGWEKSKKDTDKFHEGWLVTNTKVTTDAEQFAKCRGLKIVSWYRPFHHSLKDMIVSSGLWPITCLSTLPQESKQKLVAQGTVLCIDVANMNRHHFPELASDQVKAIQREAELVCKVPNVLTEED